MESDRKENIVCLNYGGVYTNFYSSVERCHSYNFIFKSNIDNLSLESYDAYIINLLIFKYKNANIEMLLEKIYALDKPVIIVYSSEVLDDFSGIKYLEKYFKIKFEKKDAAIIENSYDEYLPDRFNDYALSMVSKNGNGKAYIKNTNNCFILKFGKITIMHDNEISFKGRDDRTVKQKETLLINLLRSPVDEKKPDWINDIKILNEIKIEEKLEELEVKVKELEKTKNDMLKKLEKEKKYKELLYKSGESLVEIVKDVLIEMLNIPIQDLDQKKEDLSFMLNDKKILVEVKGINTAIKRENVSQIQRHIEDDAKKNNIDDDIIPNRYKGLLIINPYIKSSVVERQQKEFYSKTVIGDLMHYDICAIDTITLLGMFQKHRNGEIINLKDIILNNNYIQPNFSIIVNDNSK